MWLELGDAKSLMQLSAPFMVTLEYAQITTFLLVPREFGISLQMIFPNMTNGLQKLPMEAHNKSFKYVPAFGLHRTPNGAA